MTAIGWPKNIVNKKSLTVFADGSFAGSSWKPVLDAALKEINDSLRLNHIDLIFSKAAKVIDAHIVLGTKAGNGIHGSAAIGTVKYGGKEYADRITIAVPATPRISESDPKSREAGPGVRLYILVHELIHSTGLTNDEHTTGDVFAGKAALSEGTTAAEDKVAPFDGSDPMPPIRIGIATIKLLQGVWPKTTP